MTIKQALKLKNKLVKEIGLETAKMYQYNSIEQGNSRPYSTKESMDKVIKLTDELIELKNKIHLANKAVYGKIFRLSELKSLVSKFKQMDCTEGKVTNGYHRSETTIIKEVEISVVEKDSIIEKIESEIETIQDELDIHNATTQL